MGWKTDHRQVHYTTYKGENVVVDEGMYDVLMYLRSLGVETQYSCQAESSGTAYLVADARGMARLVRKILVMQYKKQLSPEARRVVLGFLRGTKELDVSHFKSVRGRGAEVFKHRTRIGGDQFQGSGRSRYCYERTLSTTYGNRTTLRWPAQETANVEKLLDEVLRMQVRTA